MQVATTGIMVNPCNSWAAYAMPSAIMEASIEQRLRAKTRIVLLNMSEMTFLPMQT